ncbi:MAG: thymidylate synthase [Methanothrix sp.]|jgi:thymidylate synthase|nr:thymidylate synthase [Methanothrix sp.]
MFRGKIKARKLYTAIKALYPLMTRARVHVSDRFVELAAMDSQHAVAAYVEVDSDEFDRYDYSEDVKFGLNLNHALAALSVAEKDICIEIEGTTAKLSTGTFTATTQSDMRAFVDGIDNTFSLMLGSSMLFNDFIYPEAAWSWAVSIVQRQGTSFIDEDGRRAMRVLGLGIEIEKPLEGWPIRGSGWDMPALEEYAKQLLDPDRRGFSYTYGERLCGGEVNQIERAIKLMRDRPTTRRAVATTWKTVRDTCTSARGRHAPCLIALCFQARRDSVMERDMLDLTAFFRSWDVQRAAPANMYGLAKLLEHVALNVARTPGKLRIMAADAHIYVD